MTIPDPVAYYLARLDEEEALTRRATPGSWLAMDGGVVAFDDPDGEDGESWPVTSTETKHNHADRRHIAYWDPSRVLADIAAKRAVLADFLKDEHESWCTADSGCEDCARSCICGLWERTDRRVLTFLQPYASRPDFAPEWRQA